MSRSTIEVRILIVMDDGDTPGAGQTAEDIREWLDMNFPLRKFAPLGKAHHVEITATACPETP